MLTRDRYQEELEETLKKQLSTLLESFIENDNKYLIIYNSYYEEDNGLYKLCKNALYFNILEPLCQKYNIEYRFYDYTYDKKLKKYRKSMFLFKTNERKKGLIRNPNHFFPKYPHK